MEIIVALAQQRHFARAAELCGISQPALSIRIRNLERKLGAPIVKRGNRFAGFTSEGEIALLWARRVLQDVDNLRQDVISAKHGLTGEVTVGSVPTAISFVSRAMARLRASQPGVTAKIRSANSNDIKRDLGEYALDLGVTYLSRAAGSNMQTEPLYDERYVVLAHNSMLSNRPDTLSWRQASELPLCLLSTDMNNRRIIDQVFAGVGVKPNTVLETNALSATLVQVTWGHAATIAPAILAQNVPLPEDVVIVPLDRPEVTEKIGLVWAAQEPEAPIVQAVVAACREECDKHSL